MKLERSDVNFPLWRTKVDKSLFEHKGTTIPIWACDMWGLPSLFSEVASRKDPRAEATITFGGKNYKSWVTTAKHGRSSPAYRLWFEEDLSLNLKRTFVMSYMRSLETDLSHLSVDEIERTIPFWEFLDIEFNTAKRNFHFVPYFTQEPSFPALFNRLIGSPSVARIDDEMQGAEGYRIYKQDWKPKEQLEYEIGATNVLYMLADTKAKLLYVGEAKDLVRRLSQQYSCIPNWDRFRYDVLPASLESARVPLERMIIRCIASLLENKRSVQPLCISDFKLANDKIDK
jgi:hypothetical protein